MRNGIAAACLGLTFVATAGAQPLGTAFAYQGRLSVGGTPANGDHDFEFTLWDHPTAVAPANLLGTVSVPSLPVAGGIFAATLDFGPGQFVGQARWLQIAARPTGGGAYTTLTPRQE